MADNAKMTLKMQMFCKEYIKDFNATQAAIRAGYNPKNAWQTGAENLRKPQIQAAIKEAQEAREAACLYDGAWVIAQIAQIASDKEETARDRLKALELMGKYHGIWERKQDDDSRTVHVVFDGDLEAWSK